MVTESTLKLVATAHVISQMYRFMPIPGNREFEQREPCMAEATETIVPK